MTLKISTEPLSVSDKEIAAQQAEARKNAAEADVLILSENKKKLQADCESTELEIKTNRETIDSKNQEINDINESILLIKGNYRKEKEELDSFIKEKTSQQKQLEDTLEEQNKKLSDINEKISQVKNESQKEKADHEQEIKELSKVQLDIISDIEEKLKPELKNLLTELEQAEQKILTLTSEINTLTSTKEVLINDSNSLKNNIEDSELVIKNNKVIIDQQDKKKKDIEADIVLIENKKLQKEKEYQDVEKLAFSILEKQNVLNQKTAFIKSQYERAGIKWED